ncbi:hypothetical protein GCM10007385_15490 [Tateyamaria omphalii]|nr:hypothetical protein GCM10007385_15490 [Tateyamaria omphalii]
MRMVRIPELRSAWLTSWFGSLDGVVGSAGAAEAEVSAGIEKHS